MIEISDSIDLSLGENRKSPIKEYLIFASWQCVTVFFLKDSE